MRPGSQLEKLGQAGRHVSLLHGDMDFHVRLQGGRSPSPGLRSQGSPKIQPFIPLFSAGGLHLSPVQGKMFIRRGGYGVNDIDVAPPEASLSVKLKLINLNAPVEPSTGL